MWPLDPVRRSTWSNHIITVAIASSVVIVVMAG